MTDLSPLNGKSLLVTGATGLIGTEIMRQLMLCPMVTVVTPTHEELKNPHGWESISGRFDYIIHAAGYAAPHRFTKTPFETVYLNTAALMCLLAKLNPGGRLLFLSSSEVCSGCVRVLYSEDDIGITNPAHPRAMYIESKRCGEAICHAAREDGKCAIIARVSLAYGPGCRKGDKRVMSELIDSAINNGSINLKDGGSDRRTYCYVSDTVEMLFNILLRGRAPIYNVGGASETSIVGLARKIGDLTKAVVKAPRNMAQAMDGAPTHVRLDMSRYIREFGEKQYVPLDEGLKRTIEWHRKLAGVAAMA